MGYMSSALVGVACGALLVACGDSKDLKIEVRNETDTAVCFASSSTSTGAEDAPCEQMVLGGVKKSFPVDCHAESEPLRIELWAEGELIYYNYVAFCHQWRQAGAFVEVHQQEGRFWIRDGDSESD